MTQTTHPSPQRPPAQRHDRPEVPTGPRWLLHDSWTEALRHLRIIPRNVELLIFATVQPIMFVLLFVRDARGVVRHRFPVRGSIPGAVAATALLLLFSYSLSWVQALFGLSVKSVEAANSAGFIWMFPLTFVSSAFVDPSTLPGWMEPIANANPFTIVTNAGRALYKGNPVGDTVWQSLAWSVGLVAIFSALAIGKFKRSTAA